MAREYPPVGFHFRVEFGFPGALPFNTESRFQKVSGLKTTMSVCKGKDGAQNNHSRPLKEKVEYSPLVLKRGMVKDSRLLNWFRTAIILDEIVPLPVLLFLLDGDRIPSYTWVFWGAYPVSWEVSDFDAESSNVVIETITLEYDFVERIAL